MHKILGKVISVVLLFALIFISVAQAEQAIQDEGNELVVWLYESFSSEANDITLQRIEAFEEEYGVTIDYEWITEQSYLQKYNAAVEANVVPDVTYMRSDFVQQSYPNIYLKKLDALAEEINATSPFVDGYLKVATIADAVYIIPMFTSAQPAIYRKDLFAEAGYDTFPATWAELADACIKISAAHPDIAAFGIGCGVNENEGEQIFRRMMWGYGGGLFDADGNVNANCKENAEAWQLYVDMFKAGAAPADAASWDAGTNNSSYLNGTVALTFNALTLVNALAGEGYEDLNANTGVAMVPGGPAGTFVDTASYGWAIFENAAHPATAEAFVKFMNDPEWYADWIGQLAPIYGPVFQSVADNEIWSQEPNSILIDFAKTGVLYGYPSTDVNVQVRAAQVYNSYKVNEAMSKIIVDGITVEEALDWLQAEIEAM